MYRWKGLEVGYNDRALNVVTMMQLIATTTKNKNGTETRSRYTVILGADKRHFLYGARYTLLYSVQRQRQQHWKEIDGATETKATKQLRGREWTNRMRRGDQNQTRTHTMCIVQCNVHQCKAKKGKFHFTVLLVAVAVAGSGIISDAKSLALAHIPHNAQWLYTHACRMRVPTFAVAEHIFIIFRVAPLHRFRNECFWIYFNACSLNNNKKWEIGKYAAMWCRWRSWKTVFEWKEKMEEARRIGRKAHQNLPFSMRAPFKSVLNICAIAHTQKCWVPANPRDVKTYTISFYGVPCFNVIAFSLSRLIPNFFSIPHKNPAEPQRVREISARLSKMFFFPTSNDRFDTFSSCHWTTWVSNRTRSLGIFVTDGDMLMLWEHSSFVGQRVLVHFSAVKPTYSRRFRPTTWMAADDGNIRAIRLIDTTLSHRQFMFKCRLAPFSRIMHVSHRLWWGIITIATTAAFVNTI